MGFDVASAQPPQDSPEGRKVVGVISLLTGYCIFSSKWTSTTWPAWPYILYSSNSTYREIDSALVLHSIFKYRCTAAVTHFFKWQRQKNYFIYWSYFSWVYTIRILIHHPDHVYGFDFVEIFDSKIKKSYSPPIAKVFGKVKKIPVKLRVKNLVTHSPQNSRYCIWEYISWMLGIVSH